ncbi:VIT domain-containing protein [Kaistia granuli]|uniref:VIT domain-containing protein n=1 Tax=Kaistia granuli TaxID=363259 RepID=UPI00039A47CB|nr:VIT domain-containing protein [Kaistia granuli]
MRILIRGGLALVTREQRFQNGEETSIEASITFPVPVHATLCRLSAQVGERVLIAQAQLRQQARETYEHAVDEGKAAILHEELVRGVHMLSITHIPPGEEITVSHSWILPLASQGAGKALLRIPVTLGDVYGRSPFSDADDLVTSPHVVHEAEIEVDAGGAHAEVRGLAKGTTRLRLDAPVDIHLSGDIWGFSNGRAADGRAVAMSVVPHAVDAVEITAAVLVDRSGSMASGASLRGRGGAATKHEAVKAGLAGAAQALKPRDQVELWQFDNACERVSGPDIPLGMAVGKLGEPQGGTDIGGALARVVGGSEAGEIILVTDGLSHALDVQALANSGRRFTVVLVGDDALEANVGRLAALTGGEIFLVTGANDPAAAVQAAIASVRRPATTFATGTWPFETVSTFVGGALVSAEWSGEKVAVEPSGFDQAVGAMAAAIALPRLSEEQAATVATGHGIVCHLTSLVLVDEAGAVQEGLPAQRKIPLMVVDALREAPSYLAFEAPSHLAPVQAQMRHPTLFARLASNRPADSESVSLLRRVAPAARSPAAMAARIDWALDPDTLRRGELSRLPAGIADRVREAAKVPEVLALSGPGREATAIVLALMARSLGMWKRSAARVARSVLKGLDREAVERAATALGL